MQQRRLRLMHRFDIRGFAAAMPLFACAIAACPALADDCDFWDGAIGTPGMSGEVRAVTTHGGQIVAAGNFTSAGGNDINRVARWDGSTWHPYGEPPDDGVSASVRAAVEFDGDLIVGGTFTSAGGAAANRVARWDGQDWHPMGAGFDQVVSDLAVYNGELYAGGAFLNSAQPIQRLARWDGNAQDWLPVAATINNPVTALAVYDGEVYLGGTFTQVNGMTVNRIARFDGSRFSPVNGGAGGQVSSMTVGHGALYIGGAFTSVGPGGAVAANRVARWGGDDEGWSAVGTGMGNNVVFGLTVHEDHLYAGGTFTTAGGQSAPRIARKVVTSPDDWSPMGAMSSTVWDLHTEGDSVLAGGLFTSAGDVDANRIVEWVACPGAIPGDLTGEGSVGVDDLLILLAAWGSCPDPPAECPADIDGDGVVGVDDLLILLANWG